MDSMTMTGTVMGTAGYLAPEQAQGERAGPASDRYALAVVAFELLTGVRPYEADSPTAEAAAHVHAEIPRVSAHSGLPPELDDVFRTALAKRPEDRFSRLQRSSSRRCGTRWTTRRDRRARSASSAPTRVAAATAAPRTKPLWPLLLGGLAVATLAGILLAVLLSSGGDSKTAPATALVKTVTAQGTTIRETVTSAPTTQPAPAPAPAAVPSGGGHALNDKGYALMRRGDYAGALPYLQQAVQALQGVGPSDPYEGYANYNLGYSLLQLGQCDQALAALQRADQLEPHNKDVRRAIHAAERCSGGNNQND